MVATLLMFIALVYIVDVLLRHLPALAGTQMSLERVFGWVLAPIAWLIGVPWNEARTVGTLLGTQTALNELLAYRELASLSPGTFSERSRLLATYALCGFANIGQCPHFRRRACDNGAVTAR